MTVLVSLIGRSFLSEVERPSILRTGLPVAPSLSYRLATRPLGSRPPRSGPERSDFVPWTHSCRFCFGTENLLWVVLTHSPSRRRMSAICAQQTAGVDVKLPFEIAV